MYWKPQVSWLFFFFSTFLANVFNSNIMVEMPEELSTIDSAQASLAVSQLRKGGSWFCLMQAMGHTGSHGAQRYLAPGVRGAAQTNPGSQLTIAPHPAVTGLCCDRDQKSLFNQTIQETHSVRATLARGESDRIQPGLVPPHTGDRGLQGGLAK